MDIYTVIADFNEVRLQRQLQLSIEKAMRKGSVKYKEGQHLINLSVINGDGKPSGNTCPVNCSPRKKRNEDNLSQSSLKGISKSIDSGVCIDTRDTEEEDSDFEYDEVASSEDDDEEESKSVTPRRSVRRQTSCVTARPSQAINKSSYYIKSKSLTRRRREREEQYGPCDSHDGGGTTCDIMSKSVVDTLGGWIDSSSSAGDRSLATATSSSVFRSGSKDTLLCDQKLNRIGSKDSILSPRLPRAASKDAVLTSSMHDQGSPLSSRKKLVTNVFKAYKPEPNCQNNFAGSCSPSANKGVLLLQVRKGDILGVSFLWCQK